MAGPDAFEELRRGLRGAGDERDAKGGVGRFVAGGALVAALAVALVVVTAGRDAPPRGGTSDPLVAVDAAPPPPPPSDPPTSTTTAAVARLWPAEPVEVTGNEVRSGGHRWHVGAPGDVVAIGDWDCDGEPTPAVLRRSQLFVFDAWAGPGAETAAAPGPTLPPDATGLRADGCGQAQVRTAAGRTVVVATR